MSSTEDKSSTDDSTNKNNYGNVCRGSDYPSSSFSEIEEINEGDGNNEIWKINVSSKRLDYIKEEEISRLCPSEGSRDDEDIVYVVVGKSETSTKVLQWALNNAVNPVTSTLYLTHVFPDLKWIPNPLGNGKLPRSQVSKGTVDKYTEEERTKRRQLLNKFMTTCISHRVKVETILIESDEEAKAILELISVLNIQKLVLGVSKPDLRRLRSGKGNSVADKILKKAPNWCEVKYICEGKDAFEDNSLPQTPVHNPSDADDQTTRSSSPDLTAIVVENQLSEAQHRDVLTYCCFKP